MRARENSESNSSKRQNSSESPRRRRSTLTTLIHKASSPSRLISPSNFNSSCSPSIQRRGGRDLGRDRSLVRCCCKNRACQTIIIAALSSSAAVLAILRKFDITPNIRAVEDRILDVDGCGGLSCTLESRFDHARVTVVQGDEIISTIGKVDRAGQKRIAGRSEGGDSGDGGLREEHSEVGTGSW